MNGEHAIRAAELSELAYLPQGELVEMFPQNDLHYIQFGPIKGFVLKENGLIYVAFKGTDPDELASWLVNLKAKKRKASWFPGKVHDGFWSGLSHVMQDADSAASVLCKTVEHGELFVICGHSQGAALAALYAAHYADSDRKVEVHLFGCPRVGNRKFAKWYDKHLKDVTYRWVNNNDVVTRVPLGLTQWLHRFVPFLRFLPMGFRHVGQFKYFDVAGNLRENITRFQLFKDRLAGRVLDLGVWLSDGLKDHFIDRYVELVKGTKCQE